MFGLSVENIVSLFWVGLTLLIVLIVTPLAIIYRKAIGSYFGSFKSLKAEFAGNKFEGVREVPVSSPDKREEGLESNKGDESKLAATNSFAETKSLDENSTNTEANIDKIYLLYKEGNWNEGENMFSEMQLKESERIQLDKNVALNLFVQHLAGKKNSLTELTNLNVENYSDQARATYYFILGEIYYRTRQWESSIEMYHEVAALSEGEKLIDTNVKINELLILSGNIDKAAKKILELINNTSDKKALSAYHKEYSEILSKQDKQQLSSFHLLKAHKLDPTNDSLLFDLAYNLNQGNITPILSYHFYKILNNSPNGSYHSKNNLGAVLSDLGIKGQSTSIYKAEAAKEVSISISNIATLYINAGLYEEATEVLNTGDQDNELIIDSKHTLANAKKNEKDKVKKMSEIGDLIDLFIQPVLNRIDLTSTEFNWEGISVLESKSIITPVQVSSDEYNFKLFWKSSSAESVLYSDSKNRAGKLNMTVTPNTNDSWMDSDEYDGYFYITDENIFHGFVFNKEKSFTYKISLNKPRTS